MHLRVLVNGTVEQVTKWKADIAGQSLKTGKTHKNEKGEDVQDFLQIGVRTVELIDICFPEEHLNTILQVVKPTTNTYNSLDGKTKRYPWLERFIKWSRGAMKLIPIPQYKPIPHWLDKPHISVHGIGLKPDLFDDNGNEII